MKFNIIWIRLWDLVLLNFSIYWDHTRLNLFKGSDFILSCIFFPSFFTWFSFIISLNDLVELINKFITIYVYVGHWFPLHQPLLSTPHRACKHRHLTIIHLQRVEVFMSWTWTWTWKIQNPNPTYHSNNLNDFTHQKTLIYMMSLNGYYNHYSFSNFSLSLTS